MKINVSVYVPVLLRLAPDLEPALWLTLGTLTGRLDRKLVVTLVAQRDFPAVLVAEFERKGLRTRLELVRDPSPALGERCLGVERHPAHVPFEVDLHPDLGQLVHLVPLARPGHVACLLFVG